VFVGSDDSKTAVVSGWTRDVEWTHLLSARTGGPSAGQSVGVMKGKGRGEGLLCSPSYAQIR